MLSIIIPHYHEHPQLLFTLQSLINNLEDTDVEYEIILINNASEPQHSHLELDSVKYIEKKILEGGLEKVVSLNFPEVLSHWQAKNLGIAQAKGDILLFLDAHVIITQRSIKEMLNYFRKLPEYSLLHLPIIYMLENKANKLIYELVVEWEEGKIDYRFSKMPSCSDFIEVPCMSTCGMMVAKETIVDKFLCWPSALGSYSGGEQFINFVGARLGIRKWVMTTGALYHYAAPRAYEMVTADVYRNRAIATYLFGDSKLFNNYLDSLCRLKRGKVSNRLVNRMRVDIPLLPEIAGRKRHIEDNSIITIEDWVQKWSQT